MYSLSMIQANICKNFYSIIACWYDNTKQVLPCEDDGCHGMQLLADELQKDA